MTGMYANKRCWFFEPAHFWIAKSGEKFCICGNVYVLNALLDKKERTGFKFSNNAVKRLEKLVDEYSVLSKADKKNMACFNSAGQEYEPIRPLHVKKAANNAIKE
jgi:hypothetical protein